MSTLGHFEIENFLEDHMIMDSDLKSDKMPDLLSKSIDESGLFSEPSGTWGTNTDALLELDSFLTGPDVEVNGGAFDLPMSDTSSDSGCNLEQPLLSPVIQSQDEDDEDTTTLHAVNPRTNSPEPTEMATTTTMQASSFETGATTIILPVITPKSVKVVKSTMSTGQKRRRVSASSSDSGLDDTKQTLQNCKKGKYPPLELNEEEMRICEREGIKLPTHYPLSREEEKNLKRIRRKIRNKVSAQDSRKRKKEYLDDMEVRVRQCTEENSQLHKRIEQLESQNKTLAGQLKRLHQIIVSGGFTTRQNQTSTAMMVLLLSTALFLFPGFKDHQESQKSEVDITQAIKVPPMPGHSRSLLQFAPTIKEEFNVADNTPVTSNIDNKVVLNKIKQESDSPFHDHDYFVVSSQQPPVKKKVSYIEADVPPQGYGYIDTNDKNGVVDTTATAGEDYFVVVEDEDESQLNVNVTGSGSGTRTVVLHVPKDFQ